MSFICMTVTVPYSAASEVVEYAPAFSIPDETRQIIFDSAIRLSKAVGYRNAGTLEFLVDADNNPILYRNESRIPGGAYCQRGNHKY